MDTAEVPTRVLAPRRPQPEAGLNYPSGMLLPLRSEHSGGIRGGLGGDKTTRKNLRPVGIIVVVREALALLRGVDPLRAPQLRVERGPGHGRLGAQEEIAHPAPVIKHPTVREWDGAVARGHVQQKEDNSIHRGELKAPVRGGETHCAGVGASPDYEQGQIYTAGLSTNGHTKHRM